MKTEFSNSPASVRRTGKAVPQAHDRQARIEGFNQEVYSTSSVLCIGAGGLISHVAPTLCRKGIGRLTVLDRDVVEPSNLSRQHFYPRDIGEYKAIALIQNLERECTAETALVGYAATFEEAAEIGIDLSYDAVICGIDNDPGRAAVSRHFRAARTPVIFLAVSAEANHGYVFVQDKTGPCLGCLFPDMADDDSYPCPGTPAIADILQTVGGLAVYAVDSLLMSRQRLWDYRRITLCDDAFDSALLIGPRPSCSLCGG